jgi:hypothetical protein
MMRLGRAPAQPVWWSADADDQVPWPAGWLGISLCSLADPAPSEAELRIPCGPLQAELLSGDGHFVDVADGASVGGGRLRAADGLGRPLDLFLGATTGTGEVSDLCAIAYVAIEHQHVWVIICGRACPSA